MKLNKNEILRIENLSKSYESVDAVTDINLKLYRGEMFGLVGPDGAGKTTTIRVLCGLLTPDKGEIEIFGKGIIQFKKLIQSKIGYLSQKFSLYGDLTIDENIEFFAEIHNVTDYKKRSEELLEVTRLKPFRKRLAEKLSGGMKQKLALACALIHQPEIIFLDEPTTGVDPVSRRDFWKILSTLVKDGLTVFMTTPYLDEAERCNRVAMMAGGKIIALDTPAGIKNLIDETVVEITCEPARKAFKILKEELNYEVQLFGDRLNVVVNNYVADFEKIQTRFAASNISINSSREITPSLENIFIHLLTEKNAGK